MQFKWMCTESYECKAIRVSEMQTLRLSERLKFTSSSAYQSIVSKPD